MGKRKFVLRVTYFLPLPSIFLRHPIFMNVQHFHFGLTANSNDRRRKVSWFIRIIVYSTKHCRIKGRFKVFPFDFGFKISRDLTKIGKFVYFLFWTHTSLAFVNVALSYESDWRALVTEQKKRQERLFHITL